MDPQSETPQPPQETTEVWPTFGFPLSCSKTISKLVAALARAQLKYTPAFKNVDNPFYETVYADLSSIMDATRSALASEGLAITQWPKADGKQAGVVSILMHESGEWMSGELLLPATGKSRKRRGTKPGEEEEIPGAEKFDAQTVGSAITYAKRYMWQANAGVAAEIEDDGNAIMRPNTADAQQAVADAKLHDAGYEPALFYVHFKESGTYQITGSQELKNSNRDLLKQFWNPTVGAIVVNDEQLEALKYSLEQRNVSFKPMKANAK